MTELAVLVPVLNRPQNVVSLLNSFYDSRPEDSVLALIINRDDTSEIEAIQRLGLGFDPAHDGVIDSGWIMVVLAPDKARSWPRKINDAANRIDAEWYLCGADDITFTPDWWEATKELRADDRVGVIGTNDSATGTGNPRVAAGEHTCHPLIRGRYVRDLGTADQPGLAVHDGYHHWFVDDELIWTAKQRGAWAYCKNAVIEHNHPYWKPDQVQWDDTYTLGEAHAEEDKALFVSRAHLFGVEVR